MIEFDLGCLVNIHVPSPHHARARARARPDSRCLLLHPTPIVPRPKEQTISPNDPTSGSLPAKAYSDA